MFPFHRKHGNQQNSYKQSGKRRSISREFEELEMSDEEYLQYLHNNDNSRHQLTSNAHDRYCNKILREKKDILLSALITSNDDEEPFTNKIRLGPNNNNIFKCLLSNESKSKNRESVSMPSSPLEDKNFLHTETNPRRKSDTMTDSSCIKAMKDQKIDDEYILTLKIDNLVTDIDDVSFYRIGPKQSANESYPLNIQSNKYEITESLTDLIEINDGSKPSLVKNDYNFVKYRQLDAITVANLKKLLIGSKMQNFSHQWLRQCFNFCHIPVSRWRLVQIKSGSCGVIAAVEAYLIKSLLFDPGYCKFEEPLRPNQKEVFDAFVHALSHILWQAGDFQKSVILIPKFKEIRELDTFLKDGITDTIIYAEYFKFDSLKDAVALNIKYFTRPPNHGYLNFIVCVIMSRGIANVVEDMDDEVSLITENGHCSLELVMLLINGRAVSNVFDNDIQVDSCLLKGVKKQSDVGFLSLFEHLNTCEVGTFLKSPKYPVWLVNCADHFTVLFSNKLEHAQPNTEQPFVLYHYDSMTAFSCQSDIKIVIDPLATYSGEEIENEKTYLQQCIRTKWKNAIVIYAENSEFFLV